MTSARTETSPPRRWHRVAWLLLIGAQLLWLGQVVPRWIRGAPPAFPGQYVERLLNAATNIGIAASVLVSQGSASRTPRGRFFYWLSLAVAMASLVGQLIFAP